jgi:hypothetical protein
VSNKTIVLDTGILGLLTNPNSPIAKDCNVWLQAHIKAKNRVIIPEIVDYELRRELIRANKFKGLKKLDDLIKVAQSPGGLLKYQPISTAMMRKAAQLWAETRQQGKPTAHAEALDGDVILCAQALSLTFPNVIVATTNVGHISRFITASDWQTIYP